MPENSPFEYAPLDSATKSKLKKITKDINVFVKELKAIHDIDDVRATRGTPLGDFIDTINKTYDAFQIKM